MNKNETLRGLMTKTRQNKARNEILGFQREKPDKKKHANVVRMKPMGV